MAFDRSKLPGRILIGQHLPNCALVLRVHGFAEGAVEVGGELRHVGERASDAEA